MAMPSVIAEPADENGRGVVDVAPKTWVCQRSSGGSKCRAVNPKRRQICQVCGKRRPKTVKKEHTKALDLPYELFVLANGDFGENCGICGRERSIKKRNDRDHEHKDEGLVRGILCHSCNRIMGQRMERAASDAGMTLPEWLRAAAAYIERAERRRGINLKEFM
jgi:hypothetical protein